MYTLDFYTLVKAVKDIVLNRVLVFGPGNFGGFVGSPGDFFGVLIFAPIRTSPSIEIWSTPLGIWSAIHVG